MGTASLCALILTLICFFSIFKPTYSGNGVRRIQNLRQGGSASSSDQCLARLLCGMTVNAAQPGTQRYKKYVTTITNFYREVSRNQIAQDAQISMEDYDVSLGSHLLKQSKRPRYRYGYGRELNNSSATTPNQIASVLDTNDADESLPISISSNSTNETQVTVTEKKERALRALQDSSSVSYKLKRIRQCQEMVGCPYSFKQLVVHYGNSKGYSGKLQPTGLQTRQELLHYRPPARPPPPLFWQVQPPPEFWDWETFSSQSGCGKGKKGRKGKKGKKGKRCKKGKGKKGKKKRKKGQQGPTSSEEERKFHRRLNYLLAQQHRINAHKAALSEKIGGRPMYHLGHQEVPVQMSHGSSLGHFAKPFNTAFSTLFRSPNGLYNNPLHEQPPSSYWG